MKTAPCAANEHERQHALLRYGVLDTAAEPDFDAITALLAYVCETPIALVSLIDKDRQWFKSRVGLDATETHRDLAFCAHAILQTDPLIVSDATRDDRFADNPLVLSDPNIRFYAGAPLITPEGLAIGTLCAIDTKPRTMSLPQIRALKTLAHHVVNLLELRLKLQESQQLNRELEQSQLELKKSGEFRARFFANINHEMRTPLNAIGGFTRRLKKRIANENVPAFIAEGLDMVESASKRLNELVDDVLDIAKIDANKMTLERRDFNLHGMLKEVVATSTIRAEEKNVSLALEISSGVPEFHAGDDKKMSQILLNLLSNAIKFTPPSKQVFLRCDVSPEQLIFSVVDEGVGIKQQDQQRIFLPFEQSYNEVPSLQKGTGLGLSIVKGFVDLMGGSLTLKSEMGVGSEFTVSIPL